MSKGFELPAHYLPLQEQARQLAADCADIADRVDEASHIDPEIRSRLAKSRLAEVMVPAKFGGRYTEVDSLAATVVREALGYESAHLDSVFAMQGIGSYAISASGSDQVRRTWLPRVAAMEAVAALALTEPGVGYRFVA